MIDSRPSQSPTPMVFCEFRRAQTFRCWSCPCRARSSRVGQLRAAPPAAFSWGCSWCPIGAPTWWLYTPLLPSPKPSEPPHPPLRRWWLALCSSTRMGAKSTGSRRNVIQPPAPPYAPCMLPITRVPHVSCCPSRRTCRRLSRRPSRCPCRRPRTATCRRTYRHVGARDLPASDPSG